MWFNKRVSGYKMQRINLKKVYVCCQLNLSSALLFHDVGFTQYNMNRRRKYPTSPILAGSIQRNKLFSALFMKATKISATLTPSHLSKKEATNSNIVNFPRGATLLTPSLGQP